MFVWYFKKSNLAISAIFRLNFLEYLQIAGSFCRRESCGLFFIWVNLLIYSFNIEQNARTNIFYPVASLENVYDWNWDCPLEVGYDSCCHFSGYNCVLTNIFYRYR